MKWGSLGKFADTFYSRTADYPGYRVYLEPDQNFVYSLSLIASDFEINSDCGRTISSIRICNSLSITNYDGGVYYPAAYGLCNDHSSMFWNAVNKQ